MMCRLRISAACHLQVQPNIVHQSAHISAGRKIADLFTAAQCTGHDADILAQIMPLLCLVPEQ